MRGLTAENRRHRETRGKDVGTHECLGTRGNARFCSRGSDDTIMHS